jgi:hypothetical protein
VEYNESENFERLIHEVLLLQVSSKYTRYESLRIFSVILIRVFELRLPHAFFSGKITHFPPDFMNELGRQASAATSRLDTAARILYSTDAHLQIEPLGGFPNPGGFTCRCGTPPNTKSCSAADRQPGGQPVVIV